jgi:transposase
MEPGNPWKRLPATYPPQQTCYTKMLAWKKQGVLEDALRILAMAPALEGAVQNDDAQFT